MATATVPSKNAVNRAGKRLSTWLYVPDSKPPPADQVRADIGVLLWFREQHATPMKQVAAALRYHVGCECDHFKLGSRLKRWPTILHKLSREPTMALSTMYDIAGCRAVVQSQAEVDAVVKRLESQRRWEFKVRDYVREPKHTGYRAIHLIVQRKTGHKVEIQLRTMVQHGWAEAVEGYDRTDGQGLKFGAAPADVMEYYRLGGALLASVEAGIQPDPKALRAFQALNASTRREDRHATP